MDKKNTMLLTVIAVATLLVAVVGATFAFFSLSVQGGDQTTTATVSSGKIGTVTYSSDNPALYLGVSTADMDKTLGGQKYYATTEAPSDNEFKHGSDSSAITIAKVALANADEKDIYTCSATLELKVTGLTSAEVSSKDWLTLTFGGDLVSGVDGLDAPIDLNSWLTENAESYTKTYDIDNFQLTGVQEKTVTAVLALTNSAEDDQKALAGKTATITMKLSPKADSCKVTKGA